MNQIKGMVLTRLGCSSENPDSAKKPNAFKWIRSESVCFGSRGQDWMAARRGRKCADGRPFLMNLAAVAVER